MKLTGNKIYVLCPGYYKTGGTELLHQLVYHLKKRNQDVYITYYTVKKEIYDDVIHKEFRQYIDEYKKMEEIEDQKDNLLIVTETSYHKLYRFHHIKKAIWWLSVDNFVYRQGIKGKIYAWGHQVFLHGLGTPLSYLRKIEYHLCQSYYAKNYLQTIGVEDDRITMLSDYINEIYQNEEISMKKKEDIILYNPKKGYDFTKKIKDKYNYGNAIWIAIENMTTEEVKNLMERSKVYIDFGFHPGKDRIPREAAVSGCCIITGKRGAAHFFDDVSINDRYKFDDVEENIDIIIETINDLVCNYRERLKDFEAYRAKILREKVVFIQAVEDIFSL